MHQGRLSSTLTLALLAACGSNAADPSSAAPGQELRSQLEREAAPEVSTADREELRRSTTTFALALHQRLAATPGNLMYSPVSIATALAMTYAGARTATEAQMASALSFTLPQPRLHAAHNWLDQELAARGSNAPAGDEQPFQLSVVNALWGQDGHPFVPAFLDTLAQHHGAGLQLLDFVRATEASRQAINDWVAAITQQRIQDLLPEGAITTDTRLVLTNAVYFKASWQSPFETSRTHDAPFHAAGGDVSVKTMRQIDSFPHAASSDYEAVQLPYAGGELAMVLLAPREGALSALEASLDEPSLAALFAALQPARMELHLPRFEFSWHDSLVSHLQALGMVDAFTEAADFSGMSPEPLQLTEIVHKTFVRVDEEGTEAAAATGVVAGPTSAPQPPQLVVRFDRPFLFFIRDLRTGALLFVGRVASPG